MSTLASIASGPFFAACGLLVVTGVAKVRQPRATATALATLTRLSAGDGIARALGAVEVAVGAGAAFVAGPTSTAVAALYAGFFAAAVAMRRRAPDLDCGCIGSRSAPVGLAHLASTGVAAIVATSYASLDGDGLVGIVRDQPFAGAPYVALVVCCVVLTSLFLSAPSEDHAWRP